ncbi:uncharacterized protein G2W53_044419 [Senna tora]|uniref:Uncharacterized protein n=1 Tax=Senna tora TaxID=362788 RepID=A0A834VYH9_9FABA|nr:uncharacterized protein G2W53_044419 [Senna tora]
MVDFTETSIADSSRSRKTEEGDARKLGQSVDELRERRNRAKHQWDFVDEGFKTLFAVSSLIFNSGNVHPISVTLLPGLLEVVASPNWLEKNAKFQNRKDVVAYCFEKDESRTLLDSIT